MTARHLAGYRFDLRAGAHALVTDQRPEYGGADAGPMPSELLLWSVASCFGMAVAHVAAKMRAPLPELVLEVDGEKDREAFRFRRVEIGVRADCPQERLEKVVRLARKHCFVTNTLEQAIAVDFRVSGQPEEGARE